MRKSIYSQEQIDQVLQLYSEGKSPTTIQDIVGFHKGGVRQIVIEHGKLRTAGQARRIGQGVLSLREDAFDIPTPDALYWIGFLYADGHIEKDVPYVTVTLGEKDKGHLEKFSQFMGGYLNIREVTQSKKGAPGQVNFDYKYYRVGFNCKQVHSKLMDYGFTHNKTLSLDPHPLLKNSRDFWRGVVDGDGWLCYTGDKRADGKYNYCAVGLSGTEATIVEFISFVESAGIKTMCTPKKRKGANVWQVDIHGTPAIAVSKLLYQDATTYLDRKYAKYLEFIS